MMLLTLLLSAPLSNAGFPIREVVAYEDRAEVRRVGSVKCVEGAATAELTGLPATLQREALRVRFSAGSVSSARTERVESGEEGRRAELEAEIRRLQDEQRELRHKIESEQDALQRLGVYARLFHQDASEGLRSARPDLRKLGRGLDAIHAEETRRRRRDRALKKDVAKLEREVRQRRQRLAQLGGGRQSTTLRVLLGCTGDGTLTLAYVVPHVSWKPVYDFHFRARARHGLGAGNYRLAVSARIRQATGEDWTGVKLSFSTARPRLASEAPEPAPFRVRALPKSKEKVLVQAQERRPRLDRGGAGGQGAERTRAVKRGQVVLLEVPHRVNVGSDGRDRFIPVDDVRGPGQARLVAVPSRSTAVFREVRFRSKAAYPLLPGELRVYRREALVGRARLPLVPSGAETQLSLGADVRFRARREDLVDLSEVRGFFRKNRVVERALRTTIISEAKARLPVEIRQQIPVAQTGEIKVKLDLEKSLTGTSLDAVRGHVFQTVTPGPGGSTFADLVYRVELPPDWKIP